MTDRKVWMVTGSWRGIGRAIPEGLLERGELVVATARNTGDLEGLKARFGEQVFRQRRSCNDRAAADYTYSSRAARLR